MDEKFCLKIVTEYKMG